jgi:hypothetical protein
MTHHDSHDDLQPVIEQLRANRPEASALELDAVKQRVYSRVGRQPGRARSATPMKSRLAILATLVLGMLLSTTGAGLAITGLTSMDDASVAQYGGKPGGTNPGTGDVLPEEDVGDVAGEEDEGAPAGGSGGSGGGENDEDLQPQRQVEAGTQASGGEELPFTGFLAIPVLLGGVALLSVGLVLRRKTGDDAS